MILQKIKSFLSNLLAKENSPQKLALAFSVGIYIAFSPFPGLHTAMVFASSWLFSINVAVVFAISCMINNPWTMVPVYAVDYVVGHWFCVRLCGLDMLQYNPSWMGWFNTWVTHYAGLADISLGSFLVGGNMLGILGALIMYPLMKYIFAALLQEKKDLNNPIEKT